ncbi:MAG TPA: hypothetical protein EYQ50_03785 [Verrucomicrobiales bacterium]|nr:hypothetical protein [Verrucomicrobiales bacterium]HIL69638.1 hypothetical protein [Verrucomicrobiota bacterium]
MNLWFVFAVKEEASCFRRLTRDLPGVKILVSGVGRANASRCIHQALIKENSPDFLASCGFAGGLNPSHPVGQILYSADPHSVWEKRLSTSEGLPATFHQSDQILTTSLEKKKLFHATGLDAVEMESTEVRAICRQRKIPSATIRVISDTSNMDLPLDFNRYYDNEFRFNIGSLISDILLSPTLWLPMLKFNKDIRSASQTLGNLLFQILSNQESP